MALKLYVDILYADILSENTPFAITKNRKLVTYNIYKLNELRNSKLEKPIELSDESVIVRAGKYICSKMVVDEATINLHFYDPVKSPVFTNALAKSLPDSDKYILQLMIEHIRENYHEVSGEVELVKETPWFIS